MISSGHEEMVWVEQLEPEQNEYALHAEGASEENIG